jgi:hypothetical protein
VYRRTDVVRVELIHPNENADCSGAESPCSNFAEDGEFAFVDVVHEDGIKLTKANIG